MPLTVRVTVAFVLIDDIICSLMFYATKVHRRSSVWKDVNDAPVLRLDWTKTGEDSGHQSLVALQKSEKCAVLLLKPKIVKLTTVSEADYQ